MGVKVQCPKCGASEEAFQPRMTEQGPIDLIPKSANVPCPQCGFNLAETMNQAQTDALSPDSEDWRVLLVGLILVLLLGGILSKMY